MRCFIVVFLSPLLACGGEGAPPRGGDTLAAFDEEMPVVDTALPPMPTVPDRRPGQLNVTAVGSLGFKGAWPARAGRCARPPMLLLIAEEVGKSGGSVLLELPSEGDQLIDYPVRLADSSGAPAAPAAQVGFQFFDLPAGPAAYQGAEGSVRLYGLSDRSVAGQFTVTVRHIVTEARARIAGVFHAVAVEALPPDWCERAQTAKDSLAPGTR